MAASRGASLFLVASLFAAVSFHFRAMTLDQREPSVRNQAQWCIVLFVIGMFQMLMWGLSRALALRFALGIFVIFYLSLILLLKRRP